MKNTNKANKTYQIRKNAYQTKAEDVVNHPTTKLKSSMNQ